MELLILNPNTSRTATERIAEAAEAVRQPGDVFTTLCPNRGPELIVNEADSRGATSAVIETVASFDRPCDGIILASFGNTGLSEVQVLRPHIPVIGIATAAFSVAAALHKPFALVTFGQSLVPALESKVEEAGLSDNFLKTYHLSMSDFGDAGTVQIRHRHKLLKLCHIAINDGAQAIVIGGGPLAGLANSLAPHCAVPLIDGTVAAVNIIRTVAGASRPRCHDNDLNTKSWSWA